MKKICVSILSLLVLLFISCGKIPEVQPVSDINLSIAKKLQEMDENFSDETLKAISVALRNNILINHENLNDGKVNSKYLEIAKSTDEKVLKNKDGILIEISFSDNDDYTWQKNIKKSDILEFAMNNNIKLTSLTNIKEVSDNGRIIGIYIGNQYFDYQTLANNFNLESNKIESISSSKNEIIIKGKGNNFYNHFDTKKAEQLSNDNYSYSEILNDLFDNLTLN